MNPKTNVHQLLDGVKKLCSSWLKVPVVKKHEILGDVFTTEVSTLKDHFFSIALLQSGCIDKHDQAIMSRIHFCFRFQQCLMSTYQFFLSGAKDQNKRTALLFPCPTGITRVCFTDGPLLDRSNKSMSWGMCCLLDIKHENQWI